MGLRHARISHCDELYTNQGLKEWNFGTFEGESEDLNPPLPYGDFFENYGGEREIGFRDRLPDHDVVLAASHGIACAQFARHWEANSKIGKVTGVKNRFILKFEYENGEFMLFDFINHNLKNINREAMN